MFLEHLPSGQMSSSKKQILNTETLNSVLAPLASSTDSLPPEKEQKWNGNQDCCNETENSRAPINADIVVHGDNEQRKCTSHCRSKEGVGGHRTGTEASERIDQVVESCLKDGCETKAGQCYADDRGPVVDFR